jgi:hypothetical protein
VGLGCDHRQRGATARIAAQLSAMSVAFRLGSIRGSATQVV